MDQSHNLFQDWRKIDLLNIENQTPLVPSSFQWGFSSSAVQNEGSNYNNNYYDLGTDCPPGDKVNHWNLEVFESDIKLAKSIGTNSYRLNVDWARIQRVKDEIDQDAIDHQRKMIQIVKDYGMEPGVGLLHIGLPFWFASLGDFIDEDNIVQFVEWCGIAAEYFGDLSSQFTTMVEPNLVAQQSQQTGDYPHAGEASLKRFEKFTVNVIKAHTLCYDAIKQSKYGEVIQVGFTIGMNLIDMQNKEDQYDRKKKKKNYEFNMLMRGQWLKFFTEGKFNSNYQTQIDQEASSKLDWIGVNYYTNIYFEWDDETESYIKYKNEENIIQTSYGMGIQAEGLYRSLIEVHQLQKPMIITEFGASDVQIHKTHLKRHLQVIKQQMDEFGPDQLLIGIHWWTLISNWEWYFCYAFHFGMWDVNDIGERVRNPIATLFKDVVMFSRSGEEMAVNLIHDRQRDEVDFNVDNNLYWDQQTIMMTLLNQTPLVHDNFMWGFTSSKYHIESYDFKQDNQEDLCKTSLPDNLNLFKIDIDNAKKLGANSFIIELDWALIQPEINKFNEDVIDVYNQKISYAISKGIKPSITIWHFSLPLWFEELGSFNSDENVMQFEQQCVKLSNSIAKMIDQINTMNEPNKFANILNNMQEGDENDQQKISLNLIKAHVACSDAFKNSNNNIKTSFSLDFQFAELGNEEKIEDKIQQNGLNFINEINEKRIQLWTKFINTGKFEQNKQQYEIANIKQQFDYIGVNQQNKKNYCQNFESIQFIECEINKIYPEGLQRVLNEVRKLNLPVIITESGSMSNNKTSEQIQNQMHALKLQMEETGKLHMIEGFYYFSITDSIQLDSDSCYLGEQGMQKVDHQFNRLLKINSLIQKRIIINSQKKRHYLNQNFL